MNRLTSSLLSVLCIVSLRTLAQPKPGDVFREYTWALSKDTGRELFLRVCGDGYYADKTHRGEELFRPGFVQDGWLTLPQTLDLTDAIRAEVLVERMLCHDGSTGLAVKLNAGNWHVFPDADSIPQPQSEYLYHYYPVVPLPLNELKTGAGANRFRFTIDPTQRWGMPQNMVYGMVIRVYYKATKPHTTAQLTSPRPGDVLGESVPLNIRASGPVAKVEYVGEFEDETPDFTTLNTNFSRHLDRVIQHLSEQGLVAHLMIYVWNKDVNWPAMYSPADNRYFDYVVNRYQAYPNIIWNVSKEALDYGRCDVPYINERISRIRQHDAYDRLVTVHDYEYCGREPDRVDFISIQNWRSDLASLSLAALNRHPDKPVMNIEHGGYEAGPYLSFTGNYTNPEACLIRNYEAVFSGVYSGYYWQNAAWNVVIHDPLNPAPPGSTPSRASTAPPELPTGGTGNPIRRPGKTPPVC